MFLTITENTVCEEDTWLTVEEIQKCKHYIKTVQSTQRRLHRKGRWYGKIFLCSWVELGDICYSVLCPSQHVNIALSCLAWGHRTPGHSGGFPRMLSHSSPGLCLTCQGWQTLFSTSSLTSHFILLFIIIIYYFNTFIHTTNISTDCKIDL